MKIKLTESQFKRIILSEQDSKPITNLVIAQGDPKSKIEVGASKVAKSVGLVDIIVTPDMDTKDVVNEIENLAKEGKIKNGGLDKVSISTHKTGCGKFDYEIIESSYLEYKGGQPDILDDDAESFWDVLSQYCSPSTQIFLGGCSVAKNPEVVYQIAKIVGCEVTAPTGIYNPFIGYTSKSANIGGSLGKYISCSPNDEHSELPKYQQIIKDTVLKRLGLDNKLPKGSNEYLYKKIVKPLNLLLGNKLITDKENKRLKELAVLTEDEPFEEMNEMVKEIVERFLSKYVKVMGCKVVNKPSHHTFF